MLESDKKTDREGISYHYHSKLGEVLAGDPLKKVVDGSGGYQYFHHMTNEDVLNRFRTFRAVKLQPVWSYRCERRLTRPDEHYNMS